MCQIMLYTLTTGAGYDLIIIIIITIIPFLISIPAFAFTTIFA